MIFEFYLILKELYEEKQKQDPERNLRIITPQNDVTCIPSSSATVQISVLTGLKLSMNGRKKLVQTGSIVIVKKTFSTVSIMYEQHAILAFEKYQQNRLINCKKQH